MKKYVSLLRVKHYIKNFLVFLPAFFNRSLQDSDTLIVCGLGFGAFCGIASVVYIINDILDIENDKYHEIKGKRVIASGQVSKRQALIVAGICFTFTIVMSNIINNRGFLCLIIYLLVNVAYSYKLKKIPVVDVVILASCYVLRIVYGAYITHVSISAWLYLTVYSGAFYMGLGKRRNEFKNVVYSGKSTREVLSKYTYEFLDKNMYVMIALTNVFYALWAASHDNIMYVWTVPLFIVIIMKYCLDVEKNREGDPVELILNDIVLLLMGIIYLTVMLWILYVVSYE